MIDLVSLDQAKLQCHIMSTDTLHDADLGMKITQASAIVMRYYKHDTPPEEWIVNSSPIAYEVPADIQSACLLVIELLHNREARTASEILETMRLLIPRKPTIA